MKIVFKNVSINFAKLYLQNYGKISDALEKYPYVIWDLNGYAIYNMDNGGKETYTTNPDTFMISDLSGNTPVSLSRLVKALKKQTV